MPIVFGSDEVIGPTEFYNSAFVMDATGEIRGSYRKMQLVPFGEYIPMRTLLFFAQPLVEGFSDFSAGQQLTLLPVGGHRMSVAVCYEAVFPWLARRAVRQGSQLLATITNDAWYGLSAAPYQHFQQARFAPWRRGRTSARGNTGISAVVDPYGRVVVQSPLFETGTWMGEVRWLDPRRRTSAPATRWPGPVCSSRWTLLLLPLWEKESVGGAPSRRNAGCHGRQEYGASSSS